MQTSMHVDNFLRLPMQIKIKLSHYLDVAPLERAYQSKIYDEKMVDQAILRDMEISKDQFKSLYEGFWSQIRFYGS